MPERILDLGMTADAIVRVQRPDGEIPWGPGRHTDPWNHVEAAMGLDAAGRHASARRAYIWLARMQAEDGSWAAAYREGRACERMVDANFCAYVATGVWHHFLSTGDDTYTASMWPVVQRALDFVLELQMPSGAIRWARDNAYRAWPGALLTSSSCIYMSLRCGITLAEWIGEERPDWELSLERLGNAVAYEPEAFEPKDRYAMDWYYPALTGALHEDEGGPRLGQRWEDFVVEGRGARCVADRPWITAGETSELVIACHASGLDEEAMTMFEWMQHLRDSDGLYWTGANHPGGHLYPIEKTTWSAAAVLLAADSLDNGPTAALFTGAALVPRPALGGERFPAR